MALAWPRRPQSQLAWGLRSCVTGPRASGLVYRSDQVFLAERLWYVSAHSPHREPLILLAIWLWGSVGLDSAHCWPRQSNRGHAASLSVGVLYRKHIFSVYDRVMVRPDAGSLYMYQVPSGQPLPRRQHELVTVRVLKYRHRAPRLCLRLSHEHDATLAQLAVCGLDVVTLE